MWYPLQCHECEDITEYHRTQSSPEHSNDPPCLCGPMMELDTRWRQWKCQDTQGGDENQDSNLRSQWCQSSNWCRKIRTMVLYIFYYLFSNIYFTVRIYWAWAGLLQVRHWTAFSAQCRVILRTQIMKTAPRVSHFTFHLRYAPELLWLLPPLAFSSLALNGPCALNICLRYADFGTVWNQKLLWLRRQQPKHPSSACLWLRG